MKQDKERHETCKCNCRLDASVSSNKQHWNDDKCRCECKELIDKGVCHKGFIWNPSHCECECDKSYDIGEYLDYENCKCRKKLVDKSVEECTETVEEVTLAKITLAEHESSRRCSSCKYMNRNKNIGAEKRFNYQTALIIDLVKWLQMLKAYTLKIEHSTFSMT